MKKLFLCVVFGFLFCGCFAILEPAQTKHFKDIEAYDYAYLNATQTLNSGVGAGVYGYYGGSYSVSKSINQPHSANSRCELRTKWQKRCCRRTWRLHFGSVYPNP